MRNSKFLFYLVFFSVLLFFVFPPIGVLFFVGRQEAFVAHYPLSVFLNGIIAFLIYYFSQVKPKIFENPPFLREKKPFFACLFSYSSNALVCFGVLCLSSVVFEAISIVTQSDSGIHEVLFPSDFFGFVNFFFGVIFAAFFEEVIYRFFLPNAFLEILKPRSEYAEKSQSKDFSTPLEVVSTTLNHRIATLNHRTAMLDHLRPPLPHPQTKFSEFLAVILFAAGHIYLGVFGFLNALFCGIALRICIKKTESIWIPFFVHTFYNFLSFAFFSATL